jgi:hypothetical protein
MDDLRRYRKYLFADDNRHAPSDGAGQGFRRALFSIDCLRECPIAAELNVPPPSSSPISGVITNWLGKPGNAMHAVMSTSATASPSATPITLPTSIRVGTNCGAGRTTCTGTVGVYTFETYVQDGLDNEWTYTWDTNALMAGAVAYRSYGGWFVANPICPTMGSTRKLSFSPNYWLRFMRFFVNKGTNVDRQRQITGATVNDNVFSGRKRAEGGDRPSRSGTRAAVPCPV